MAHGEIEKGVPLPLVARLHEMEVGDSITWPRNRARLLRMNASKYKVRHLGWDYTTCTIDEDTIRLWRTA